MGDSLRDLFNDKLLMTLLLGYASIILTIFVLATFFPKEKKCNEYIYLETQEKHYEKK